jgi:hypothetical protein
MTNIYLIIEYYIAEILIHRGWIADRFGGYLKGQYKIKFTKRNIQLWYKDEDGWMKLESENLKTVHPIKVISWSHRGVEIEDLS